MVLAVVLEIDRELVDAEVGQRVQPVELRLDGAEDAEPVDDLVGDERGVRVPRLPVLVVVVRLATLDVVGERRRHRCGVAVSLDEVGHVIADHAAEPTALVAHVGEVFCRPDVGRGGDAHGDVVGIPTRIAGSTAHGVDRPLGDGEVGELQDEPVAGLADQLQGLGAITGAVDVEPALGLPTAA